MRVLACVRHYLCLALFAGCAAVPVLLMGQDTTAGTQEVQHACMWNEAVCQHGDIVSIGLAATDKDMSKLDSLHDVKELGFMIGLNGEGGPKISDAGFAHVQSLRDLKILNAMSLPLLTDAGFAHVQSLRDLKILNAMSLPLLTDDALRSLSRLYHLQEVRLEYNGNFSDAGLAHFEHLKRLQTLTFFGSPITDRGILYLRESTDMQMTCSPRNSPDWMRLLH